MKKKFIVFILIVIFIVAGVSVVFLTRDTNEDLIQKAFFTTEENQMFYYSSPAVDDEGNIYIGTSHKSRWEIEGNQWSENYYLLSFYPNETLRWKFQTTNSEMVKGGPAIHPKNLLLFLVESYSPNPGGSMSNATYNKLYALNLDGTLNWSSDKLNEDVHDGSWGSNGLHPAIDSEGHIYVQGQHHMTSFYENGTIKWRNESFILNYAGSPSIYRDTVYFPSGDTNNIYIYAFYTNGSHKWTYKETQYEANNRFNMISIDNYGKMYVGTDNEKFYAINPDGSLSWIFTIPTSGAKVRGNVAIDTDGTIYIGTKNDQNSEFYALNPNGSLKWKYQEPLRDVYSSPTITDDGSIFFATEDRFVFRVNKYTGEFKEKFELEDDITWSSCTIVNGKLYIGDMSGRLYNIGIPNVNLSNTPWACLGANYKRLRSLEISV